MTVVEMVLRMFARLVGAFARPLERLANKHALSCAKHVTWTRQHAMTQGEKALVFIALRRMFQPV
ncbi:MAG: hypothetical protein P8Y71_04980 [Pseudolabrys sp.]